MLTFKLGVLDSASVNNEVLAAWELASLFLGSAAPNDLPIDAENTREQFIQSLKNSEAQLDFQLEPQLADDEIAESFSFDLRRLAKARSDRFGDHYPFTLNSLGELIRKDLSELSIVGACYLSLQAYRAMKSGTVEVDGANAEVIEQSKADFQKTFEKLFEYIAGYTVSGRKGGTPFMLADCRSSRKLEIRLKNICRKLRSGQVLPYANWNLKQKHANDGGIDCLVQIGGPEMPGDASIALVAATIQSANIDKKIPGIDELSFFDSFFTTQPAAFQGALVKPQDHDELTKFKCVEKNCLFFSYDQICDGMAKRSHNVHQRQALKKLDARARRLIRKLAGVQLVHEYERYSIDAAI